MSTPRVFVVGGGFAGLAAAKALAGAPAAVTLFDRRNHHVFGRPRRARNAGSVRGSQR